ncbi:hypothetical protein ACFV5J_26765 [Streptomyces zaomyceticus]|uniref:hypothetical protein n=1 Tax=Streptomyces zaomyceticus TaxID=68286 RepID=UPI00365511CA
MRSWARGSLTWAGPGIVKSIAVRCTGSYDCHPGAHVSANETHAPCRAGLGRIEAVGRGEGVEGGGGDEVEAPGRDEAPERRVGARVQLATRLRPSGQELSRRDDGGTRPGRGPLRGSEPTRMPRALITWDGNVDRTVCRARRHAAGAAKEGISRRNRPA